MAVEHALFQHELYFAGMAGETPALPMSYPALEAAARDHLDDRAFGYVAGGAGVESTMANNRRALDDVVLVPRMMRDVTTRDLSIELLGATLATPVLLGPVGVQSIIHPDAEKATARAAAGLGLPFVLSTVSSFTLEDVAEEAGDGPRWFQLYWPAEREVAASLVRRAEAAGYGAIVVTLDTKLLAWRPRDLTTAYLPFLHAEGLANYLVDPAFLALLQDPPEANMPMAILRWAGLFSDKAVTWDDLAWLAGQTALPIVVKGIQHVDDAVAAIDHGVAGMIVSNHGGRQIDGAVGSARVLPDVVDAVAGRVPVLFDSGIRSGADIAKALALGASAVLVARPWCWGLALGGEDGVRHVLRSLLAELDLTMALAGVTSIDGLNRDILRGATDGPAR